MKRIQLLIMVILVGIIGIYGQQSFPALKSESAKAPKVVESDIVLKMPYHFYYFKDTKNADGIEEKQLHCYYPKTQVDVTLDLSLMGPFNSVDAAWYDDANKNAYIVFKDGGLEFMDLTVYRINSNNTVSPVMTLAGHRPNAYNDYDASGECYAEKGDNSVRLRGYQDGKLIDGFFSFDLKPLSMPVPSAIKLQPLNIGFVKVNSDGVNVRKTPNPKAPRLGYFYCAECEGSDYINPELWEDDPYGVKPFTPFHPDKGMIYFYNKTARIEDGWHPIENDKYISEKFVDEIIPEKITSLNLRNGEFTHFVNQGKYVGLYMYMTEDGMDEEGQIHFGKIDDNGIIQFYAACITPRYNENVKGLQWDDDLNSFWYGPNYENKGFSSWECYPLPLDLKKLTTADIDLLMSKAKPLEGRTMIYVKFPNEESFFYY